MKTNKLRVIQDFYKLSKEIQEQVKLVYPDGFSEYLITYTDKKGELVTALPFETFDKTYMIRMSKGYANLIISDDDDYDKNGILKKEVKNQYEDKHNDVDYLTENENYSED